LVSGSISKHLIQNSSGPAQCNLNIIETHFAIDTSDYGTRNDVPWRNLTSKTTSKIKSLIRDFNS
jgi:hypothetical protein